MNLNITQKITQLRQHLKDPLYRNSIFLITNTAVTTGLGFFFWMIVARYYREYEVGVGAAIISSVTFLALLSTLGLDAVIVRFLSKAERPAELINSCLIITGIAALVISGIFLAGLDLWSPATRFVRDNGMFILSFLFFAVAWALSMVVDSVYVAMRRAEFNLAKNTIFSLLKIPLPIILTIFFHAFGIVSSWGLATGIALAISFFLFLPRVQRSYKPALKINLGIIKNVWKYSAGNYFSQIFMAAPFLLLPVIIVNVVDAKQNAYFYVAWMIAGLLFTIPSAVAQSLFAEGSHAERDLATNSRRSFKFVVLLLVPAIIIVVLLGKYLLLLFGENYSSNAMRLLWILGFSSLFTGVNYIYYSILRVRGRIGELVALRGLAALAVLITSAIVTPILGIVGIGYAWIGAQALVSIYVLLAVKMRLRAMRLRRSDS